MSNVPTDAERAATVERELEAARLRKPVIQGRSLIRNAAHELLELLDYTIPEHVGHWAVHEARAALKTLEAHAGGIHVHGWQAAHDAGVMDR